MQVRDVMTVEVRVAHPDTPLVEAARQMREHGIGLLPVTEGERLIGVITDRDMVVRCIAENQDPRLMRVAEIVSVAIVCCFDDEPVKRAKALMLEQGVRRLPVIDRSDRLVGIVSQSDLSEEVSTKKPKQVTFHKEKTDSYGRPHKVPLKTIYITGSKSKDEAAETAVKKFEEEHRARWSDVANGYEIHEESPGGKDP